MTCCSTRLMPAPPLPFQRESCQLTLFCVWLSSARRAWHKRCKRYWKGLAADLLGCSQLDSRPEPPPFSPVGGRLLPRSHCCSRKPPSSLCSVPFPTTT